MAIFKCEQGFALARGAEVVTDRGNTRNFGQGGFYVIANPKALADQIALGWLVEVGGVEAATAAPGEKRNVTKPEPEEAPAPKKAPAKKGKK